MLKPISHKLLAYRERMKAQAEERFWARVDKSGGSDACWPWMGARYVKGYGHVCFRGKHQTATHVAWTLAGRKLPVGLFLLHSCDYPPCCNPAHLFVGTKKMNGEDCRRKGRTAVGQKNGMHTHPETRMPGDKNPMSKLTWDVVRRIRKLCAGGMSQKQAAKKFRISQMTVSYIVRNIQWKEPNSALRSEV
jgi:predicted DNA-binding protein (UPF0251 family)